MIRHQTRSTLFPYTTLFRSRQRQHGQLTGWRDLLDGRAGLWSAADAFTDGNTDANADPDADSFARQDRKSPRLNLSHVKSSYAVLCLTKNHRGGHNGSLDQSAGADRQPAG